MADHYIINVHIRFSNGVTQKDVRIPFLVGAIPTVGDRINIPLDDGGFVNCVVRQRTFTLVKKNSGTYPYRHQITLTC